MTRIKNVSRPGWFVIGLIVAALLVPSVAVASGLKFTGIEGSNGITATLNKAGVSSAGQVLTSPADPSTIFTDLAIVGDGDPNLQPVVIGSGGDKVVTQVDVDLQHLGTTGSNYVDGQLYSGTGSSCTGTLLTGLDFIFDESTVGDQTFTFPTGLPVPSGDELCVNATYGSSGEFAVVTANGYGLPTGTVAGPAKSVQAAGRFRDGVLVP